MLVKQMIHEIVHMILILIMIVLMRILRGFCGAIDLSIFTVLSFAIAQNTTGVYLSSSYASIVFSIRAPFLRDVELKHQASSLHRRRITRNRQH